MTETPAMKNYERKYQFKFSLNGWYIQLLQASIWYRFYSPLQINENMQLK